MTFRILLLVGGIGTLFLEHIHLLVQGCLTLSLVKMRSLEVVNIILQAVKVPLS